MWTFVGPSAEVAVLDGFAVGETVEWWVRDGEHLAHVPVPPEGLDIAVDTVEDADYGIGQGDDMHEQAGTVTRILMLTGRGRKTAIEITATPATHVHVLDLAGFLVELDA